MIVHDCYSVPRRMTTPSETTSTCWSELYGKMLGPTMKNQNKLVREIPATLISSNRTRKLGCTSHSLLSTKIIFKLSASIFPIQSAFRTVGRFSLLQRIYQINIFGNKFKSNINLKTNIYFCQISSSMQFNTF